MKTLPKNIVLQCAKLLNSRSEAKEIERILLNKMDISWILKKLKIHKMTSFSKL